MSGPHIRPKAGEQYNHFTLTGNFLEERNVFRWECVCVCGKIQFLAPCFLTGYSRKKSCGCTKAKVKKPRKFKNVEDIVGMKFNSLVVLKILSRGTHGRALVKCDCGNEVDREYANVKKGWVKNCGCVKDKIKKGDRYKSLIGKRFGSIVVLDDLIKDDTGVKFKLKIKCDCGREEYKGVFNLFNNKYTSCKICRTVGLSSKYFIASFLNRLKTTADVRNIEFNITLLQLDEIYEKQGGLCYYTGDKLVLPTPKKRSPLSVDRIDSSKGYTYDNVVLCIWEVNRAKHVMNIDDFIDMCHKISDFHRKSV